MLSVKIITVRKYICKSLNRLKSYTREESQNICNMFPNNRVPIRFILRNLSGNISR